MKRSTVSARVRRNLQRAEQDGRTFVVVDGQEWIRTGGRWAKRAAGTRDASITVEELLGLERR